MNTVFGAYGRVGRSTALIRDSYEWSIYCYLDCSFDFLLDKPMRIPQFILDDEALFLSFLAGYTDSEGSFRAYPDSGMTALSFRINSEDELILRQIVSSLKTMGYHIYFSLCARRNTTGPKRYRRDLWSFGMFRTQEIVHLVRRLPIRHDEKQRWASLLIASSNDPAWNINESAVVSLRQRIREEVRVFCGEAEQDYLNKPHRNKSLARSQ